MVQVEDKIVSFDIFEKQFVCDLSACKGACCVDGDAGAPLTYEELDVLSKIFDEVKPYMRQDGIMAIEQQGMYVVDADGDNTTTLVDNKECAFVSFDQDGTAKCSIEQACECGQKLQVPVYRFLKEPLVRSYGVKWFEQLCEAARLLKKD